MQISQNIKNLAQTSEAKISNLIQNGDNNKPLFSEVLSDNKNEASKNFKSSNTAIWINKNYNFDPSNPRKPNMRELMEALSETDIDELFSKDRGAWKQINHRASEILYGVIGADPDTRDWNDIMNSENILKSAREQTGAMYEPTVDILSTFDEKNNLTEQTAVIKDKEGNTLRSIPENLSLAEETLNNFGATQESIPTNLEEKIDPKKFDNDLLTFLKNFDNNTTSVQQIVIQSASEAIANKISQEIPLDELAKL